MPRPWQTEVLNSPHGSTRAAFLAQGAHWFPQRVHATCARRASFLICSKGAISSVDVVRPTGSQGPQGPYGLQGLQGVFAHVVVVVTVGARPKRATPCRASHVMSLLVQRNEGETVDTTAFGGMSSWLSGWPH